MLRIPEIARFLLITLLFLSIGCKNEELERQNKDLQAKTQQLSQDLAERDTYIDNVASSIDQVYAEIESAHSQEKQILQETAGPEGKKKLSNTEIRKELLARISVIDSNLRNNHQRIADLQKTVNSYKKQFAGLRKLVTDLKQKLQEREEAIVELQLRVQGLETEVAEKGRIIAERDSLITRQTGLIGEQHKKITTGFYVTGARRDLEEKGILKDEGGFLWGLLGSTSVLANGFDTKYFTPINKVDETTIHVNGRIRELIPKRDERFYSTEEISRSEWKLVIKDPTWFWQDNYLVIVTD
jgi:hypothetical protein